MKQKKKKSSPKIKVYDRICDLSADSLCEVKSIKGKLYIPLDMIVDKKHGYYTIETFTEKDYGCYGYDYSETTKFAIYGVRDESDDEYEKRIELDEKANKHKEEEKQKERDKELAELERLKKKYNQ